MDYSRILPETEDFLWIVKLGTWRNKRYTGNISIVFRVDIRHPGSGLGLGIDVYNNIII